MAPDTFLLLRGPSSDNSTSWGFDAVVLKPWRIPFVSREALASSSLCENKHCGSTHSWLYGHVISENSPFGLNMAAKNEVQKGYARDQEVDCIYGCSCGHYSSQGKSPEVEMTMLVLSTGPPFMTHKQSLLLCLNAA